MIKGYLSFQFKRLLSTDKTFFSGLHAITGLFPRNEELYKLAFIHKSASVRLHDGMIMNNERLEFLGDAILDAVVAEYLYMQFPNEKEGFLTQTRSKIVNGDNLGKLAKKLGLDQFIVSYASNFNNNRHILGDAFEALIGAIYMDHGYKAVKTFVFKQLINKHIDLGEVVSTDHNYKSRLIEWAQKEKKEIVFNTNQLVSDNSLPLFISVISLDQKEVSNGKGSSKKEAEQKAAKKALENIDA